MILETICIFPFSPYFGHFLKCIPFPTNWKNFELWGFPKYLKKAHIAKITEVLLVLQWVGSSNSYTVDTRFSEDYGSRGKIH